MRPCGDSDLKLPVLGMGCWSFGGGEYWGPQDQSDVNAVVHRAVELGVTYFDTAEAYNEGRSERSLGLALAGIARSEILIGTKISPSHVQPDVLPGRCEASLRRLGVETVDLYMVHWPITPHSIRHFTTQDIPCPSVEDTFSTLLRLRDQGKIRYLGVSNFAPAKVEEALGTGTDLAVNELPYNLLARAIEMEALPCCVEKRIGVIGFMQEKSGFSFLKAGMLTTPIFISADLGNLLGGGLVKGLAHRGWTVRRARGVTVALGAILLFDALIAKRK